MVSIANLENISREHRPPRHGDKWGRWRFDAHRRVLVIEAYPGMPYEYEVDLDRCTTPAAAWDWVQHVAGKTWATDADVGALIRALDVLTEALRAEREA